MSGEPASQIVSKNTLRPGDILEENLEELPQFKSGHIFSLSDITFIQTLPLIQKIRIKKQNPFHHSHSAELLFEKRNRILSRLEQKSV